MTNQEVLAMQKALNAKGYRGKDGKKLTEDGLLGANITYALQTMLNQEKGQTLAVDGVWGPATQAAYDKYRGSVSSGSGSKATSTGSTLAPPKPTPLPFYPNGSPPIPTPLPRQPGPLTITPLPLYQQQPFNAFTADIMGKAPATPTKPATTSSVYLNTSGDINSAKANAKSWQILLNQQGYRDQNGNRLAEDGIWGPKTEYAWLSYQQAQPKKISATPNKTTSYTQSKMEEDLRAIFNKQVGKAVPVSPAAGADFWTAYQTANDPNLKKLQTAMAADPQAAKVFSSPEKIRNEQQVLNALGFTGQDGKKLREDGVLDLNTLVAYDKLTHNSSFFGNSNSPIMRAVDGKNTAPKANWMEQKIAADTQKIATRQAQAAKRPGDGSILSAYDAGASRINESDLKSNWLGKNLHAGVTNLTHAPIRAFYNAFYGGNYDPEKAANDMGRFFRQALQEQDSMNQKADLSLSFLDPKTPIGKLAKNYLAPMVREIPALVQDTALIYASGGLATPATGFGAGSKVTPLQSVARDLKYVARQPVTVERAVFHFFDYFDTATQQGDSPEEAATKAMAVAIQSALIDGIGMTAPEAPDAPFVYGNLGKAFTSWGKKAVRNFLEDKAKKKVQSKAEYLSGLEED